MGKVVLVIVRRFMAWLITMGSSKIVWVIALLFNLVSEIPAKLIGWLLSLGVWILNEVLSRFDIPTLQSAWDNLPVDMRAFGGAIGVPEAMGIIVTGASVRLVLQLVKVK